MFHRPELRLVPMARGSGRGPFSALTGAGVDDVEEPVETGVVQEPFDTAGPYQEADTAPLVAPAVAGMQQGVDDQRIERRRAAQVQGEHGVLHRVQRANASRQLLRSFPEQVAA